MIFELYKLIIGYRCTNIYKIQHIIIQYYTYIRNIDLPFSQFLLLNIRL